MTPELGVIEGYFGRAWSWPERRAVVDILAPAGFRFFHYAPKADEHLRRQWQHPHGAADAAAIAAFGQHCAGLGVRFGLGFTPYGAHLDFGAATRAAMRAKLAQFDDWGVADLAILFDDMRGDIADLAERQAEIAAFILDHSRAGRFFLCPSYYSSDVKLDRVFGARPAAYLETLGRLLDPAIAIYWTGEEICSPAIGPAHLRQIGAQLGRKVALWDNYPVNDGPRMAQHLHLRAFTGRPPGIAAQLSHHAINPASQPLLGCIPALTLPMVYAKGEDYCHGAAFMAAAEQLCGPALAAMLREDLLLLQATGLDRMTEAEKDGLRRRYGAVDHPAARELIDWLAGGYAITGEHLQTQ